MTRITVDVNDEWLDAAREVLGTDTKVGTINAALHSFALRKQAAEIMAALDSVKMDFSGSENAWRYGGGRDLSRLEEAAREEVAREREEAIGKADAA
ncbi:MAG: DUF2191 domain-containing protein [Actinobacteria bacterium 13_2_20CM_2_72_6]|nr:MAG: DUF2191 domain-containing protein [Actinobacteria bacterium 13_2_20CM_2_72_6]